MKLRLRRKVKSPSVRTELHLLWFLSQRYEHLALLHLDRLCVLLGIFLACASAISLCISQSLFLLAGLMTVPLITVISILISLPLISCNCGNELQKNRTRRLNIPSYIKRSFCWYVVTIVLSTAVAAAHIGFGSLLIAVIYAVIGVALIKSGLIGSAAKFSSNVRLLAGKLFEAKDLFGMSVIDLKEMTQLALDIGELDKADVISNQLLGEVEKDVVISDCKIGHD
jgi:hypothetical protein